MWFESFDTYENQETNEKVDSKEVKTYDPEKQQYSPEEAGEISLEQREGEAEQDLELSLETYDDKWLWNSKVAMENISKAMEKWNTSALSEWSHTLVSDLANVDMQNFGTEGFSQGWFKNSKVRYSLRGETYNSKKEGSPVYWKALIDLPWKLIDKISDNKVLNKMMTFEIRDKLLSTIGEMKNSIIKDAWDRKENIGDFDFALENSMNSIQYGDQYDKQLKKANWPLKKRKAERRTKKHFKTAIESEYGHIKFWWENLKRLDELETKLNNLSLVDKSWKLDERQNDENQNDS